MQFENFNGAAHMPDWWVNLKFKRICFYCNADVCKYDIYVTQSNFIVNQHTAIHVQYYLICSSLWCV